MNKMQRTLAGTARVTGIGLHTGGESTIAIQPAPTDTGVLFRLRTENGHFDLKADLDHVIDVNRGTTIANGEHRVHTVEHVLSALAGLEIDNAICELDNTEPPVGDGSAKPFVDAILTAGVVNQDVPKNYLEIEEPISYSDPASGIDVIVLPSEDFRVTFMVDYENSAFRTQYTSLVSLEEEYAKEFAPARTFCFWSEVRDLWQQNLIRGGSMDSAVVIVDAGVTQDEIDRLRAELGYADDVSLGSSGILNDVSLRFPNEPARHKVVDLIGDLSLVGMPIRAHVLAARSGHAANVEVARKLRAQRDKKVIAAKYQAPRARTGMLLLDAQAILKIMPHRYPMLLIDRIVDLEPGARVTAIKNVTINEPYFVGHYPGHPVMPGVLIVEAMAQAGGFLLMNMVDDPESKVVYFMGIDNVRFRKPVVPGDQIRFELTMQSFRRSTCKMSGQAFVDDKLVTEAQLMAMVVER